MDVNNIGKHNPLTVAQMTVMDKSLEEKKGLTVSREIPPDNPVADKFTLSWSIYKGQGTLEDKQQAAGRYLNIYVNEMPDAIRRVNMVLPDVLSKLETSMPALQNKHWDFSVDSAGKFVAVDSEQLTSVEKEELEKALNQSGFHDTFKNLRDIMIDTLEAQRGPFMYSTGIGRYDLNTDNFSGVVRFREFLENAGEWNHYTALAGQVALRADDVYSQLETYSRNF